MPQEGVLYTLDVSGQLPQPWDGASYTPRWLRATRCWSTPEVCSDCVYIVSDRVSGQN